MIELQGKSRSGEPGFCGGVRENGVGRRKETDPNMGRFLELTPLFSKKTDPNLGRFPERKNMNHDLAITGPETAASEPGEFDLGTWLGRRQAFGLMAGKSAAADVDCLRHIRDTKSYKSKCRDWGEFCAQYIGASKTHVNRMIQCLDKFGPQFFELTQLTRVSPQAFDAIAPHLTDEGLTLDGETFALRADNSRQVAAAVAELRKRAEASPEKSPSQILEERFEDLIRRVISTGEALDSVEKRVIVELLSRLNQSVQGCHVSLLGYHCVG